MPKFLLTTYHGLTPTARKVVSAPHIPEVRAQVLSHYPRSRAAHVGLPCPHREEFRLKYDDPDEQYAHVTLSFTLHREDTAPFEMFAS